MLPWSSRASFESMGMGMGMGMGMVMMHGNSTYGVQ